MGNNVCGVEGCKNKYYAKGYCAKHYQRLTRGKMLSVQDRKGHHGVGLEKFWNNIDKNGQSITPVGTPCWIWKGGTTHRGYGVVYLENKNKRVHCLSWELHNGLYDKKLQVCHKCDTPACCNPEHLFLGTAKENAQDKVRKGRAFSGNHKGEKCAQAKLTEKQVLNIRSDIRSNREIGREYNMDFSSISDIKRRKTWKHI